MSYECRECGGISEDCFGNKCSLCGSEYIRELFDIKCSNCDYMWEGYNGEECLKCGQKFII